jgi:hypothetical protein
MDTHLVNICKLERFFSLEWYMPSAIGDSYYRSSVSFSHPYFGMQAVSFQMVYLRPGQSYKLPRHCGLNNVQVLDSGLWYPLPDEWKDRQRALLCVPEVPWFPYRGFNSVTDWGIGSI